MLDLEELYESTYNPKTEKYVRKDGLLRLIPDTPQNRALRNKILSLLPKYPANLIVQILTTGFPKCPCCNKDIKVAGTGKDAGIFNKTCSRKCQDLYASKYSDYAINLKESTKQKVIAGLQGTTFEFVKSLRNGTRVRCKNCGVLAVRHPCNIGIGCSCTRGDKVSKARLSLPDFIEAREEKLTYIKSNLLPTDRLLQVHPTKSKVKLHCSLCSSTRIRWFASALNPCPCTRRERQLSTLRTNLIPSKKLFKKAFLTHIKNCNLKLLDEYIDSQTRIDLECLECNYVYTPVPYHVMYVDCCPRCSKIRTGPIARETARLNCLATYGVDHWMKVPELKAKFLKEYRKTCRKRYGVDYPLQNPGINAKVLYSAHSTKKHKLGTRTVHVQGYEPQALDWILSNKGIKPNHIHCGIGNKNIPSIRYEFEGKVCVYHPDFYIPTLNRIIEVKSTYTYKASLSRNLAKQKACIEAGFKFTFLIMNADGTRNYDYKMH